MLYAVILIMAVVARGGADCSSEETCESCIGNKACAYVLGQTDGDQIKSYRCVNAIDSRNKMTVELRIRDPEDCFMAEDITTEISGLPSSMQSEMQMLATRNDVECPPITPLMIAFFILSLLLAVVVSVAMTIGCWVGCCGADNAETQNHHQSSPMAQEHEMMPTV